MKTLLAYFKGSILFTVVGLALGTYIGYYYSGQMSGAYSALFILVVLSILEISISFDNAIVNATVLKDMTPLWQRRFLTWGMLIAVFGMRLVFPLLIVGILAHLGPIEALKLAAFEPQKYADIMLSIHVQIAAYGGAFLFMVALKYFFDTEKEVHWVSLIERPLSKIGKLPSVELGLSIVVILIVSQFVAVESQKDFLVAGAWGLVTYIAVDGIGTFMKLPGEAGQHHDLEKASVGMFLYLEVLDASFSFDGVVGAFAITNNLFLIAIGLGIGAMFVRSITILLVEKKTLNEFKYLEHGAFYAVGALGMIMFISAIRHIPELISGLIGITFIGLSIFSSLKAKKSH